MLGPDSPAGAEANQPRSAEQIHWLATGADGQPQVWLGWLL